MSEGKNGHFLLGLLLGGAAAFGAALYLAPKTGDETKKNLNEFKDKLAKEGKTFYHYASEAAGDWMDNSADKFSGVLDKTSDTVSNFDLNSKTQAAKSTFDNVTSNLRSHFNHAKAQLNSENSDKEDYDDIVIDATDDDDIDEADVSDEPHSAFEEAKQEAEEDKDLDIQAKDNGAADLSDKTATLAETKREAEEDKKTDARAVKDNDE